MFKLVLACCVLVGCETGGDSNQPTADAPPGTPMCTKALYDMCTDNSHCTSGNCKVFDQSNFTVCTQACSASNPCPNDSTGAPAQCNTRGLCKPATATVCVP